MIQNVHCKLLRNISSNYIYYNIQKKNRQIPIVQNAFKRPLHEMRAVKVLDCELQDRGFEPTKVPLSKALHFTCLVLRSRWSRRHVFLTLMQFAR